MAKRSKKTTKKRGSKKKGHNNEIVGIVVIGLGGFAFLSTYTSSAGIVGHYFNDILKGLFGIVAYVMPAIIVTIGVLTILSYHKRVNKAKVSLTIVPLVLVFNMLHLVYFDHFNSSSLIDFVVTSYNKGIQGCGAGALLSPIVYLMQKLFGLTGSYLFVIVFFIVDVLMLTNLSLKKLGKDIYYKINESRANKSVDEDIVIEEDSGRKSFVGETIVTDELDIDSPDVMPLQEAFTTHDKNVESTVTKDFDIVDFENGPADNEEINNVDPNSQEKSSKSIDVEVMEDSNKKVVSYTFPPIDLLKEPATKTGRISDKKVRNNARLLEETLKSFGVTAKVIQVSRGPAITRYELQPAPGIKVSKIVNLADDIALNLAASGVRIEAPIPGKAAIGVEVPNRDVSMVLLREVLEADEFSNHPSKLAFALGMDIAGKVVVADIARMPHLLIAGATGSGKSVCINTLIASILYKATPDEVKLIMVDPKVVELSHFNGIPHLLIPVVTDPKKAAGALNWAVQEMASRYKLFADKGVRDLERYNETLSDTHEQKLPQIVVIIDELADLMMVAPGDVEDAICRLAQMARAAGIHLVIATQRPSVDVITGVIKANIPSRIAFAVSSQTDSRTILDMGGAEKLLGRGDMLFYPSGASKPIRVQGCFVSEREVEAIVEHIKNQYETPSYNMEVVEEIAADKEKTSSAECDELLPEAIEIVIDAGQASISMLQRRLRIGYARAARLIDEMEVRGIVSGFDGSKPRNVLISKEEFQEKYMGDS